MIEKFEELTEEQIESATLDQLRAAYRALLAHHVRETEELWRKLRDARQPR